MRKVLFIMMIAALLMITGRKNDFYPVRGIIAEINRTEDIVYFVDPTGNEWGFYGVGNWQENDMVVVIMDDNGTENIYDDQIITVWEL